MQNSELNLVEPDLILGGSIAIFKNRFTLSKQLIENTEAAQDWETAKVSATDNHSYNEAVFDFESRKADSIPVFGEDEKLLDQALNPALDWYKKHFNCEYVGGPEGYAVARYLPGGYFNQHEDFNTDNKRIISTVFYLNSDFEGGNLKFPHLNIEITPEEGMLVLFPSNYAYSHIAMKITSGVKYSVVSWCR